MRLSVALCTYNGEKYIREQLLSIHNQTVPVDEIIVCDDCSKDDTVPIVQEMTERYGLPVRLFMNSWNLGCRRNFERAICHCTGDIIFLSDQDDIWLPDKVETIVNYFDRHPEKNFAFTDAILINQTGADCYDQTLFGVFGMDSRAKQLFDRGHAWEVLSIYCRVTGATSAFRASLIPYCIPFSNVVVHDEAIAIASTVQNKIGYIDRCLIKYRQHEDQAIGLRLALSLPTKHWEVTPNIMMWHELLIEPFDKENQHKLRFLYRRFWTIRSPWAFLRLTRLLIRGDYRKYAPERGTFLWDLKARGLYLLDKMRSVAKLRIVIDKY